MIHFNLEPEGHFLAIVPKEQLAEVIQKISELTFEQGMNVVSPTKGFMSKTFHISWTPPAPKDELAFRKAMQELGGKEVGHGECYKN